MALIPDDAHGARDLTNNNAVANATGKVGNGAQLASSVPKYLSVASDAGIEFIQVDFYGCVWVKFDSLGGDYSIIAAKRPGTYNGEWQLMVTPGGDLIFECYGSGGVVDITSSVTPTTGVWYFIEFGVTGATTGFISVDRAADDTGTVDITHAGGNLFLGYDGGAGYCNAVVDQFALYSAVPGAAYRNELYNSGSGKSYASLSSTVDLVLFYELEASGGGSSSGAKNMTLLGVG